MSEYIIKGPIIDDNVQMGVGEYFWRTAEKFGDRICQIHADTHQKETFAEVNTRALRVSIQLKKLGVQPQDVVMVSCENDLDCIIPILAALFLGAQVSPCVPFLQLFDVQYIINNVKPKVIFVIQKQLKTVEEAIKILDSKPQLIVIGQSHVYPTMYDMENIQTEEERSFKPVKVNVHDTAFILFSSGTTSMPKGICFPHYSVVAGPCRLNGNQTYVIDSPIVIFMSIYWVSSVWITAFCILNAQPRIVAPLITTKKFYELVAKYKIAYAFASYSNLISMTEIDENDLKKYDLSSIQFLYTGGASIDPKYILKLRKIFPNAKVNQSYASTEMGVAPTGWDDSDKDAYEEKITSVGKVSPNVEIKIVDLTTRKALGPNQQGEILVRSPYRMNGFSYNDNSSEVFDKDGFLKSGDIGYYDEQGYFYIVERLNEMFKFRGIRMSPTMIEDAIRHHPTIQEVVVFGIPHELDFSHPVACVTLKNGAHVTAQEISDYVAKNMADIYRPIGGIKFLRELPRTPTGKISRKEVKKLFLSL